MLNLEMIAKHIEGAAEEGGIRFVFPVPSISVGDVTTSGTFTYFLPLNEEEAEDAVGTGALAYDEDMQLDENALTSVREHVETDEFAAQLDVLLLAAGFEWGSDDGTMVAESGMQEQGEARYDMCEAFREQMRAAYNAHLK